MKQLTASDGCHILNVSTNEEFNMFASIIAGFIGGVASAAIAQFFDVTAIATFCSYAVGIVVGIIVAVAK